MTINRDGKEYELTETEMREIFEEMQFKFRKMDIDKIIAGLNTNKEIDTVYAADILDNVISKDDGYWACYWECVSRAINIAIGNC